MLMTIDYRTLTMLNLNWRHNERYRLEMIIDIARRYVSVDHDKLLKGLQAISS